MDDLFSTISEIEKRIKGIYLSFFYAVLFVSVFLVGAALEHYFPELFAGVW